MSFPISIPMLARSKQAGELPMFWDFRYRTLLDLSGGGNTMVPVASAPEWKLTKNGPGIYFHNPGVNILTCGNPVSLQLTTPCTVFCVAMATGFPGVYNAIFGKNRWGWLALRQANTTKLGFYASGSSDLLGTKVPVPWEMGLWAYNYTPGAVGHYYANGLFAGTSGVRDIVNQTRNWYVGGDGDAGESLQGFVLLAGVVNRLYTSQEHAQLHAEWAGQAWVGDSPKKLAYSFPASTPHERTSKGVYLESDFNREFVAGVPRVLDLAGNWPGVITGVPQPGTEGKGMRFAAADTLSHGDVTQLNNATKMTFSGVYEWPSTIVGGKYLFNKYPDANNHFYLYMPDAGATSRLQVGLSNGVAYYSRSSAFSLRAGTRQHIFIVVDGDQVGNDNRLKVWIDRELQTMVVSAGAVPASLPNMAGIPLIYGAVGGNTAPNTTLKWKFASQAHGVADMNADYLKHAQQIDWMANGESTPVTLAASTADPAALGGWTPISGTWKVSEDATGKRWLECVVAGTAARPQPSAFGTFRLTIYQGPSGNSIDVVLNATLPVQRIDAAQKGYFLWIDSGQRIRLGRKDVGAGYANLLYSDGAYAPAQRAYTFTINRRVSDGRFTVWVQGGTFVNHTLVVPQAGVGGTNPTVADATHTTSAWMVLSFYAGDKILIHDQNKSGQYPHHYQGQLDPTAGELPV